VASDYTSLAKRQTKKPTNAAKEQTSYSKLKSKSKVIQKSKQKQRKRTGKCITIFLKAGEESEQKERAQRLIPLFLDQRLLAFQALFTFLNQLVKKIKHLK